MIKMNKLVLVAIAILLSLNTWAKKVKFEVDMTDQTISTYGVHVSGDFQAIAGYPGGDWQPGTTELINEPGTQIYSVIVDIPAFAKYEFKFLNGDQWYDSEFVPWESRVGYNFNDNRWIFVDSIANDTSTTMPIMYAGNAPFGLKLLRFKVDLHKEASIDPVGVHVAGTFQGWNPMTYRLYGFDTTIYDFMAFVEPGYYEYKYYNGNTIAEAEVVPFECSVNSNRWVNVVNDTILDAVCFSECSFCVITEINEIITTSKPEIYPNPSYGFVTIKFSDGAQFHDVFILDLSGRIKQEFKKFPSTELFIESKNLPAGIYVVRSENEYQQMSFGKLVIR